MEEFLRTERLVLRRFTADDVDLPREEWQNGRPDPPKPTTVT